MPEVTWHYCATADDADEAGYGGLEDNACDKCGWLIGQYIVGRASEQLRYRPFWWTNDIGARAGVDDTLLCDECKHA